MSGSGDNTIRLWNLNTNAHKATLTEHTNDVTSVAFSPDGQILASAGSDETIHLWDTATETLKTTFTGHTGWNTSVAFSSDGRTLVSSGDDQMIQLWDYVTFQHKSTITGHTFPINEIAFSPNGQTFASVGDGKAIHLWDTYTGQLRDTLIGHQGRVFSVAFSPNNKTLASGAGREILQSDCGIYTPSYPTSLSQAISLVLSPSCSAQTVKHLQVEVGTAPSDYGMPIQANTKQLSKPVLMSIRLHSAQIAARLPAVGKATLFTCGM